MAQVSPVQSGDNRLDTEETRFLQYQEVYRSTSVPMPPQGAAAPRMTPTAKATKVIGARRNSYGPSAHSKRGLQNISRAAK